VKPSIIITAGDPLGIGPEITVKALKSAVVRRACNPSVTGDTAALRRAGWTPALCPLLPADAPGSTGIKPDASVQNPGPLDSWLQVLFGTGQ